jgi:AcrR family transcriptional regulator
MGGVAGVAEDRNQKLRLSLTTRLNEVGSTTRPMTDRRTSGSRPTTKKRALVRGEPIVNGVLRAAIEELARAGYRALRIEDVALRAGVNKTTIYRRWPTKIELVRAALASDAQNKLVAPETGSLRADLLEVGRTFADLATSPEGQSVMRMMVAEGSDPEVADLEKSLRETFECVPSSIVANAVARGEIAPSGSHPVMLDAFVGAIHHRIFMMNEPVTDDFLARLADIVLLGALLPAAREEQSRDVPRPRKSRVRSSASSRSGS